MDRSRVVSSSVVSVGYSLVEEVLEVEFSSGGIYQYLGVPSAAHEAFLRAESKGRYVVRHVKGRYAFRRVGP